MIARHLTPALRQAAETWPVVTLRHPKLQAEDYDEGEEVMAFPIPEEVSGEGATGDVLAGNDGAYFVFRDIDLTGVQSFTAQIGTMAGVTTGGRLDLRAGGVDGEMLGTFEVPIPNETNLQTYEVMLEAASGVTDLYFVFSADEPGRPFPVCFIDWILAEQ